MGTGPAGSVSSKSVSSGSVSLVSAAVAWVPLTLVPLATAIPRFRFPEEKESRHQGYHGPGRGEHPQLGSRDRGVAVGAEVDLLAVIVEIAEPRVERLAARSGHPLGLQDGVADQGDVDGGRVDLQQVADRRMVAQRTDRLDAVHDPGGVHPGPHQEWDELTEVIRARAQPGQEQAHADVEYRLQHQGRDG